MTEPAPLDDDVDLIKEFQLDALERMQTDPSRYVWRVVEEVGFLPTSGQCWERQVQLCLPSLPKIAAHSKIMEAEELFIVSLGTFRRRRFADFSVTTDDGSHCHLLTRRQHGYALAACLLRQFLDEQEWERASGARSLAELHGFISRLITTMPAPKHDFAADAGKLLSRLFGDIGINDEDRRKKAIAVLGSSCKSIAQQTQYLCWVTGKPGSRIFLRATYTQTDTPRPHPESRTASGTRWSFRLKWRNWRTRQYARYNIFPQRYTFDTPGFDDCKSYYFKISPPSDSRMALLDWGSGRRFRTIREDRHMGERRRGRAQAGDMEAELDCAEFAYHFHNRRSAPPLPAGESYPNEKRNRSRAAGGRLHAFVRIDPTDNSKLIAAGLMGLALAILAQRGSLFSTTSGASQWLLLAPGALVLFVTQQRRHHYARVTTPYRVTVWLYIVLAMLFAGSVAFDAPAFPLLSDHKELIPRVISALFAIGSGLLVIASAWSAFYFERSTRKRFRRVMARVHVFSNPAFLKVLRKYRWKKRYWRMPREPLSPPLVAPGERDKHPSDKVYAAVARHEIDRALLGAGALTTALVVAMLLAWNWGVHEGCAIVRTHAQRAALAEGRKVPSGKCVDGQWKPQEAASTGSTRRANRSTGASASARPKRAALSVVPAVASHD